LETYFYTERLTDATERPEDEQKLKALQDDLKKLGDDFLMAGKIQKVGRTGEYDKFL
jgi:hypothetical protein